MIRENLYAALILGILTIQGYAQNNDTIIVTTQEINIPGSLTVATWLNEHPNQQYPDYPKLYYGFAQGDDVFINFETKNKQGTQQMEITDYESKSIIYSNKKFQTLENVKIPAVKSSVFQFEFATNHMFDRQCKVVIKRKPGTAATQRFNCNVTWKMVNDTTFASEEQKFKTSSKLEVVNLQSPINHFINSGGNAFFEGGKSRIGFPIILPENTIEWYYIFSATRNPADVEATKSKMKLFSELTRLVDQSGLLDMGFNAITEPPGANYGDVYLIQPDYYQSFLCHSENWKYIADGSRENLMSGKVKINACCTSGRYFIGLRNPDASVGLNIMIEVVAIVENATYETKLVKRPISITAKKEPVFGN